MTEPDDTATGPVEVEPAGPEPGPGALEAVDLEPVRFDTDPVEPIAPVSGRPSRRQTVLGVVAAAVAIVLTVSAGVVGAVWSEHRDLVLDYRAAAEELGGARAAYDAADARLAEARGAVRGIVAFIDPILALTGEPVPAAATAALAATRDAALGAIPEPPPSSAEGTVAAADPDALSNEALLAGAPELRHAAHLLPPATAYRERLAAGAETIAAELGTAFVDYTTAVAARGAELIATRGDASADSLMALQSAIDALPAAATEDVEEIVTSAITAAAEVVTTSNRARIDDPDRATVVVNKHRPLQPIDYVPELVWADVPYGYAPYVRPVVATALAEMFAAFTAETGEQLLAQSSYRSYDDQVYVYNGYVESMGRAEADRGSARPGHSEHQTGLTVDVGAVGWGCLIQQCFGDMLPGQWLAANAWRYGFLVRYPDGYEHITGFKYEPWHMRYTGVDITTDMHERGIVTLEEYYGLEAAPDYL